MRFFLILIILSVIDLTAFSYSKSENIYYQEYSETEQAGLLSFLKELFSGLMSNNKNTSQNSSNQTYTPPPPKPQSQPGDSSEITDVDINKSNMVDKFNVCKMVKNGRTDYEVMVPHNSSDEWESFRENTPQGVNLSGCFCGRKLTYTDLWQFFGDLSAKYHPLPPKANVDYPILNGRDTHANKVCELLGCGPAKWFAYRTFNSPGNNTILRWNTSLGDWEKYNASEDNIKINPCKGGTGETLECFNPGDPISAVQKQNCD